VERKLNEVAGECLKEIRKRIIIRSTSRSARKVPVSKKQRKRS